MEGREPEDLALVRNGRRSAKTIIGEKLLLASQVNLGVAQDQSKRTVVGAHNIVHMCCTLKVFL